MLTRSPLNRSKKLFPMPINLRSLETLPDTRAPLETMLHAYMSLMMGKLAKLGGPKLTSQDMLHGLWDDFGSYLPPNGRVFLAEDENGTLMGCGFLRQVRMDAGEMKRLYVRPETRGTGLGRKLVLARIEAARQMGWRTLYADTLKGNTPMLSLYESLGFHPITRYPENANDPALDPFLVYLQHDLRLP